MARGPLLTARVLQEIITGGQHEDHNPRTVPICLLNVPPAARAADTVPETVILTLPHLKWVLEIETPDMVLEQKKITDSKDAARLFAHNEETGMNMSAFLEKADHPGDAKECRAFYWEHAKKSPFKKDDFSMSESGGMAILQYLVKEFAGLEVRQKHMNAYLSRDGHWMDIHLSKVKFKPGEELLFKNILDQIRIKPKSSLSQGPARRHYALPEQGSITLDVPGSWVDAIHQSSGEKMPPTIVFEPPSGRGFSILVTPA